MKKFVLIPVLTLLVLWSCKLNEINDNPNIPGAVPLETLMPPVSTAMANAYAGRVYRYSNIFTNHMEGVSNQELQTDRYNVDEGFVGRIWSDLYGKAMINLRVIIEQSTTEQSPHYRGVAKILMAHCLGTMTSMFGDVPYTEALNVNEFPNPAYDAQEEIYATIQQLLQEGIEDIDAAESVRSPGSDDLLYFGDRAQWKKAAYVLRARYHMHLTKRNPGAADAALSYLSMGFTNSGDDLKYKPLGISADMNGIYAFFADSPNMKIDPDFEELVNELNDPRTGSLFSVIPFTGGQKKPGPYFSSQGSHVPFISYVEQLFLLAECHVRLGNTGQAQSFLQDAIRESCELIGQGSISQEDINAYVDVQGVLTGNLEGDLERVITQKYIALFTQLEPWTDFRRTGYPELVPNDPGVSGINPNGEIPRRLIYPQDERLFNSSVPMPIPNMQQRFWWDE
ncbi:MAG: RagB/SusD family nutrient uptake outer membrane protein [Cryomorphaceae bacterium]|nr:MAG: RagB/SusD family nutrient uptake outer membrane protein [Cryomorphaceae bacterium]